MFRWRNPCKRGLVENLKVRRLPENLRGKLKKPFGLLLKGWEEALKLIEEERPPAIITVGDRTSRDFAQAGVKVKLFVLDGKVERRVFQPFELPSAKVLKVKNPAGTISMEALNKIKEALEAPEITVLMVEGEEDLLTLPAVAFAPEGALVFYGQPGEGLVAVKVNGEKRVKALSLMESMPEGELEDA